MGRDLQRAHGQPPQAVLTVPLLVGTDGVEKMGKSLGNWIGIEEPPDEQFGKVMSIPDDGDRALRDARDRPAAGRGGGDRAGRDARAARPRTGPNAGSRPRWSRSTTAGTRPIAAERASTPCTGSTSCPPTCPSTSLPPGDPVHLPALLVELGFAKSSSAARRLIDDGAVRVDGDRLPAREYDLARDAGWPGTCWPRASGNLVRLVD